MIAIKKVRSLYGYVMRDLKVEQLNEIIINLHGTDILLITIWIILTYWFYFLLILCISLKMLFCFTVKIQALQKLNKTDDTDIQIQIGEFNEK